MPRCTQPSPAGRAEPSIHGRKTCGELHRRFRHEAKPKVESPRQFDATRGVSLIAATCPFRNSSTTGSIPVTPLAFNQVFRSRQLSSIVSGGWRSPRISARRRAERDLGRSVEIALGILFALAVLVVLVKIGRATFPRM